MTGICGECENYTLNDEVDLLPRGVGKCSFDFCLFDESKVCPSGQPEGYSEELNCPNCEHRFWWYPKKPESECVCDRWSPRGE